MLVVPTHPAERRLHPRIGVELGHSPVGDQLLEVMSGQTRQTAGMVMALLQRRLTNVVAVADSALAGVCRAHPIAGIVVYQPLEQGSRPMADSIRCRPPIAGQHPLRRVPQLAFDDCRVLTPM